MRRYSTLLVIWGVVLSAALPAFSQSSYDLRDVSGTSYVTPVKDQSLLGTCWAFASYAAMESNLLMQGLVTDPTSSAADLSEWHLANWNGMNTPDYTYEYDDSGNWGGNPQMAVATMARGQGPVLENQYPRDVYVQSTEYPLAEIAAHEDLSSYVPPQGAPTTWMLKGAWDYDLSNATAVKNAVQTYGALATAMYWTDSNYDDTNYTYYTPNTYTVNHGVTIAGWDDSKVTAGGTGAWLIKNSWGTGTWGGLANDNGYFWLAYGDASLSDTAWVFQAGNDAGYGSTLQHQTKYPTNYTGYGTTNGALGRFTAPSGDETDNDLTAVGLWTVNDGELVTIDVYTAWDDQAGGPDAASLALSMNDVAIGEAGYHLIDLDSIVQFSAGQEIIVAITGLSGGTSLAYESGITPGLETTYYWNPNAGGYWDDFYNLSSNSAYAMKLVMTPEPGTAMIVLGGGVLVLIRRRRRAAA